MLEGQLAKLLARNDAAGSHVQGVSKRRCSAAVTPETKRDS
jgi:hypothetical protein